MKKTISYAAIIAAMSLAVPALAQPDSSVTAPPPGGEETSPAPGAPDAASDPASAPTGAAADTSATVSAGMNVKDNTGATIGQVTDVKPDASGQQTATIQMGADTFAVGTSSLAVQGGDAVVNATQAELRQMIQK